MGIFQGIGQWLGGKGSKKQKPVVSGFAPVPVQNVWIVRIEQMMFRLISLSCSAYSASAIARFFIPSVGADAFQIGLGITLAVTFALGGFFLSRSIAYRMLRRESWWGYLPLCVLVVFVEWFCNYILGIAEVSHQAWLQMVPPDQRGWLTVTAYMVISVIPLMTLLLAVVDMDLERKKHAQSQRGHPQPKGASANSYPAGQATSYQGGYQGTSQQWQQGPGGVNGANPPVGPRSGKGP